MMDDVYLLNSPFTFQSMEKHAAYCAMMRLGLKVPKTVLVPYKNPPDNTKYAYTASRYNQPFDLDAVAEGIGYQDFCDSRLRHLDEIVLDWVAGPDFDRLLVDTVTATYPAHERDRFVERFRGLLGMWVKDSG
ncbi:hypothetical protein ACIBO2_38595 [Nonomuraea sp. NPDC050022]|uniref:hypothetical protein n=1 Tax=Nonomuraea sp. NPDC050022 TaxID=3364358 RepID=UPI0037B320CC